MPNVDKKSGNFLRGNYLLPIIAGVLALASLAAAAKIIWFSGNNPSNTISSSQISSQQNSIYANSSIISEASFSVSVNVVTLPVRVIVLVAII